MESAAKRVCKPDHVLVQPLNGELALLNLNDERYFTLDDTGTRMWDVLTSSPSIGHALERLQGEYDADSGQIGHDLDALLRQLVEYDLVQLVDA